MLHPEFEILSGDDDDGDAGAAHRPHRADLRSRGQGHHARLRTLMHRILETLTPLDDPLPEHLRSAAEACRTAGPPSATIHFPPPESDLRLLNAFRSPAQFRLIFEEFFWLECGLALKRAKARLQPGIAFELNEPRPRADQDACCRSSPPARRSGCSARSRTIWRSPHPMNRLLQGDVGSGKTLVAAEAAIIAIENGYQVAVLAPTEILATQHYFYFRNLFKKLGYIVRAAHRLGHGKREKTQLKKLVAAGLVHVVIGTHALLEEDVEFDKLGLAIVDEQHRFGVDAAAAAGARKATHPDVLVMTATPIPRTLALTLYGDLDVSVIDELPPGRKPIVTKHVHRGPRRAGVELPEEARSTRAARLTSSIR